jgi:hypothetical protein
LPRFGRVLWACASLALPHLWGRLLHPSPAVYPLFRCLASIVGAHHCCAPHRDLNLSVNGISGAVPASLSCLSLQSLSLASNALTSVSAEVLWRTAGFVDVSQNALTGTLPIPVAAATHSYSSLNVSYNYFLGPLPYSLISSQPTWTGSRTYIFDWNCFDPPDYRFQSYCDDNHDNCGNLAAQNLPAFCINHKSKCVCWMHAIMTKAFVR